MWHRSAKQKNLSVAWLSQALELLGSISWISSMSEPLPETRVLANGMSRKLDTEWKKNRKKNRQKKKLSTCRSRAHYVSAGQKSHRIQQIYKIYNKFIKSTTDLLNVLLGSKKSKLTLKNPELEISHKSTWLMLKMNSMLSKKKSRIWRKIKFWNIKVKGSCTKCKFCEI